MKTLIKKQELSIIELIKASWEVCRKNPKIMGLLFVLTLFLNSSIFFDENSIDMSNIEVNGLLIAAIAIPTILIIIFIGVLTSVGVIMAAESYLKNKTINLKSIFNKTSNNVLEIIGAGFLISLKAIWPIFIIGFLFAITSMLVTDEILSLAFNFLLGLVGIIAIFYHMIKTFTQYAFSYYAIIIHDLSINKALDYSKDITYKRLFKLIIKIIPIAFIFILLMILIENGSQFLMPIEKSSITQPTIILTLMSGFVSIIYSFFFSIYIAVLAFNFDYTKIKLKSETKKKS